jgi:hypothetical protein
MKKMRLSPGRGLLLSWLLLTVWISLNFVGCSSSSSPSTPPSNDQDNPSVTPPGGQIIADHTVVDKYDQIPQEYIDKVKTLLVDIAGESHSTGYREGLELLSDQDPKFAVTVFEGKPPTADQSNPTLRFGSFRWTGSSWQIYTGESTFYTNADAINGIKNTIRYCHEIGQPLAVIGFGWCWDMTWHNGPGGEIDPIYKVHWAGASEGGPDGDERWGLDAGDCELTGNHICMDTYLNAVEVYRQFCREQGYDTVPIFTTGPVDGYQGENGFQREIKHQYIRDFVTADPGRALFDYADILVYNNAGEKYESTWDDGGTPRKHAQIHPDNSANEVAGTHIGREGCIRLAKAMWWMLARLQGWDGK